MDAEREVNNCKSFMETLPSFSTSKIIYKFNENDNAVVYNLLLYLSIPKLENDYLPTTNYSIAKRGGPSSLS